jgi:hypothetical protein
MSLHPIRGWIYMLVPMIGLGIGAEALAERKVDWTPYLEQPGERVKPRATPRTETIAKQAPKAKASRRVAKQRPQAQAQAKPKAKRKTKR